MRYKNPMGLNSRFYEIRQSMNWSKAEASRQLKISKAAIHQIETGATKTLRSSTLTELARITGYNALWISEGRGKKKKDDDEPPFLKLSESEQMLVLGSALPLLSRSAKIALAKQILDSLDQEPDDLE
jgi:transcriptional regulator with XRE-family HTH domain